MAKFIELSDGDDKFIVNTEQIISIDKLDYPDENIGKASIFFKTKITVKGYGSYTYKVNESYEEIKAMLIG